MEQITRLKGQISITFRLYNLPCMLYHSTITCIVQQVPIQRVSLLIWDMEMCLQSPGHSEHSFYCAYMICYKFETLQWVWNQEATVRNEKSPPTLRLKLWSIAANEPQSVSHLIPGFQIPKHKNKHHLLTIFTAQHRRRRCEVHSIMPRLQHSSIVFCWRLIFICWLFNHVFIF